MHVARAVVDANVWISAALTPGGPPSRVVACWRSGSFEAVLCQEILDEVRDVLDRPRVARRYDLRRKRVDEYIELIQSKAALVRTPGRLSLCRDPDDDLVLEAAIAGNARYIVTRDDDLKGDPELVAAMAERGVEILTVQRFLDLLDAPDQR